MTIHLPPARPRLSDHTITSLAVLSPLLTGLVWSVVTGGTWLVQMDSPDADLGTFFAFWAILFYGFIGLLLLVIPLTVGIVAQSPLTRLAAAWVEALLCASAAAFWALSTLPHQDYRGLGPFGYFSIAALLVPLLATCLAHRQVMRRS